MSPLPPKRMVSFTRCRCEYENCSCHLCIKFELHSNVACNMRVGCIASAVSVVLFISMAGGMKIHASKAISRPVQH